MGWLTPPTRCPKNCWDQRPLTACCLRPAPLLTAGRGHGEGSINLSRMVYFMERRRSLRKMDDLDLFGGTTILGRLQIENMMKLWISRHPIFKQTHISIHICMYVCMYICTYVRMYVRTYVCTYVCMYVCTYVRMYVRTYIRTYVCTYVCMYVCTYVRMYVYIYIHMYMIIYISSGFLKWGPSPDCCLNKIDWIWMIWEYPGYFRNIPC